MQYKLETNDELLMLILTHVDLFFNNRLPVIEIDLKKKNTHALKLFSNA